MPKNKTQKNILNGWRYFKLGNIVTISRGGSPRPIEKYLTNNSDGINWLRIGDIKVGDKYIFSTSDKIIKDGLNKTTVVKEGDFILSNSMSFGRPYIMKTTACIHDGWLTFQNIKTNVLNRNFLYYLLSSHRIQSEFLSISAGSGVQNLKKETVSEISLFLPLLSEQNSIVAILETWDKYLEKLSRKIEIKRDIKKGIVLQIMNCELSIVNGKKVYAPKLRLPGFSGGWESVKLMDTCDNVGGTSLEKFTGKNFNYKFISIGNYSKEGAYIDNGQRIKINEKTRTKLLDKNNLVMVLNDKTHAGDIIGATILIDENNKYIYNQRSERLICKKNIESSFAWYYLNSKRFRKKVFALSQGGTQIYVNFPNVKKIIIELPSLKEQIAIAKVLTIVDQEIEALEKKKKIIEEQKKFLLNNLVTGRIRV